MKFRANIEHAQTFYRIIQSIERLQKRCIVRLTPTEMHIICNEESEDGVQVWSQIRVDALFTDYRIQSNAGNEISLLLSPEALLAALRSASSALPASSTSSSSTDTVVMKLAKKHGHAVLSFEIPLAPLGISSSISGGLVLGAEVEGNRGARAGSTSTSSARRGARIAHDVLIDVLRPTDMAKLKEPLCPEPDIHILLPPLPKLRVVAERLRTLAPPILHISASRAGVLRLGAESDSVRVETQWTRCIIPSLSLSTSTNGSDASVTATQNSVGMTQQRPPPSSRTSDSSAAAVAPKPDGTSDPDQLFGVHVSARAFLKFLSSHVVSSSTIACICEDHCIILYVYIGSVSDAGGVLTFYIPARIVGD